MKGRELLLRQPDALRFIQDCRSLGLVILGMDFYEDAGDQVRELLCPADYSGLSYAPDAVERTASAAEALIGSGLPDDADWVSFVVAAGRAPQR